MQYTAKTKLTIICIAIALLATAVLFFTSRHNATDEATGDPSTSIDIAKLRPVITSAINSRSETDRTKYVHISETITTYEDGWMIASVALLDELPDSYNRDFVFILRHEGDKFKVIDFQPPGWFNEDDLPDNIPHDLYEDIIGEAHGD